MEGGGTRVFTKQGKLKKVKKPKKEKKRKGVGPQTFVKKQEIEIPKNEIIEVPKPRGRPRKEPAFVPFVFNPPPPKPPRPKKEKTEEEKVEELGEMLGEKYQPALNYFKQAPDAEQDKILEKTLKARARKGASSVGGDYGSFTANDLSAAKQRWQKLRLYVKTLAETERYKEQEDLRKKGEIKFGQTIETPLTNLLENREEFKPRILSASEAKNLGIKPPKPRRSKSLERAEPKPKPAENPLDLADQPKKRDRPPKEPKPTPPPKPPRLKKEEPKKKGPPLPARPPQVSPPLTFPQLEKPAKAKRGRPKKEPELAPLSLPGEGPTPKGTPKSPKSPKYLKNTLTTPKQREEAAAKAEAERKAKAEERKARSPKSPSSRVLKKKEEDEKPLTYPQLEKPLQPAKRPRGRPKKVVTEEAVAQQKKGPQPRPFKSKVTPVEAKKEKLLGELKEQVPPSLKGKVAEVQSLDKKDEKEHDEDAAAAERFKFSSMAKAAKAIEDAGINLENVGKSESRARPSESRARPSESRARPSESRARPSESRVRTGTPARETAEKQIELLKKKLGVKPPIPPPPKSIVEPPPIPPPPPRIIKELQEKAAQEEKEAKQLEDAIKYVTILKAAEEKAKEDLKKDKASVKLTSLARGSLARKQATAKRAELEQAKREISARLKEAERLKKAAEEYNLAIASQKLVRGKQAKAKVAELKETKERTLQTKANTLADTVIDEVIQDLKEESASTKLQSYVRTYLSTHKFKSKKEATTKIQNFFRVNAAMKKLSLKKQDKLLEDMIKAAKEEELQEELQDKVRYEKELTTEAELLKLDAIEDAINELETEQQSATTLQSATRKRQAKKQLDALKKDRDELKAAIKLQSTVRAYKPRRELAAYKTEKELERLAKEQEEEQAQQELITKAKDDYEKKRAKAEAYYQLLQKAEAKDRAERGSSEGAEKGGKKELSPRKARPAAERKAEREKAAKLEQDMEEARARLKAAEDAEEKRQQALKDYLEKEKRDEAEAAEKKAKKKAEKEATAKERKAKAEAKGKKPKEFYMEDSDSDEDLPLGAIVKRAAVKKPKDEAEAERKRNQRLQEELEAERKRNEENAAKLKKQLDKINGASGQVIIEELKEELEALGITTANQLAEIPRKLRYKIIGLSAKDKAVKLDVLDLDELERADAELAEYRKKSAKEKRELIAKDRAEGKAKEEAKKAAKAEKEEGSKLLKVKAPAAAAEPEEDVYDYDISAPTFQRVFSKVKETEKAAEKADKAAAKAQAAAEKRATKEAEKKAKEETKAKAVAEKAAAREARKAEARKGGTAEKAKPLAALKVPEEVVAASQSPKSPQTPKYAFTGMYGITQLLNIDAKDLSENPELKAELVNTDKVFKERKAKAIAEGKTFDPELNEYAVSQLEKIRGLVELDKKERAELAGILAQARANNKKSAAKKAPPEKLSLNKGVSHFEALEKEAKQAAAEAADEPVGSGLPYGRARGMGDLSDGDVESQDGGGSDQEEKLSHYTYIMPSSPILRRGFKHPAMVSPGMSDHLHPNAAANIHAFSGGLLGRGRSRSRSPSPDDMRGMGMSGCGSMKDKMAKMYKKAVPKSLRPAVEELGSEAVDYAVNSKKVKGMRQDAKEKYEKTVPKSLRPAVAELAKDTGEFAKRQSGFGLKKGSEAARKFMAELRARKGKKMKGGKIPEPHSRSPITDPSLL